MSSDRKQPRASRAHLIQHPARLRVAVLYKGERSADAGAPYELFVVQRWGILPLLHLHKWWVHTTTRTQNGLKVALIVLHFRKRGVGGNQ